MTKFTLFIALIMIRESTPEAVCANPGWSENGSLSENTTRYSASSKVYFSCKEHYTNIDKNFAVCTDMGTWSDTPPRCAYNVAYKGLASVEVLQVDAAGEEKRRKEILSSEDRLTDENMDTCVDIPRQKETKITIDLKQDYNISGVKIRFNYIDEAVALDIKIGRMVNNVLVEETCGEIRGKIPQRGIIVHCLRDKVGNSIHVHDRLGEGFLAVCDISAYGKPDIQKCGQPPDILFGKYLIKHVDGKQIVNYNCDEDFRLVGRGQSLTCVDGKWSSTAPICRSRPCPALVLNSGNVAYNKAPTESNSYPYETEARHSCHVGHFLEGEPIRRCQRDGTWSRVPPFCHRVHKKQTPVTAGPASLLFDSEVSCSTPKSIAGTKVVLVDGTKRSGSRAQYTCVHNGNQVTITCLEDGSWSENDIRCEDSFPTVTKMIEQSNGYDAQAALTASSIWIATVCIILGTIVVVAICVFFRRQLCRNKVVSKKVNTVENSIQPPNSTSMLLSDGLQV